MANLFDTANALTTEPRKVVVGDFLQWKRDDLAQDYPPTDYTLTYVARVTGGGASEIQIVAQNVGGTYFVSVDSETTEAFEAGFYHWQAEISRNSDGNRIVVNRGEFEAIPDLDVNQADPRTHAEIVLDKVQALLEGRMDTDVSQYTIAGRQLTKMSMRELLQARDYYRREVYLQRQQAAKERGEDTGSTVKVRF